MEDNVIRLDNETMYMNLHTVIFPDTKFPREDVDKYATKHKAVANYVVHALINVIFSNKEDALSFYKELNDR